MFHVVRGLPQPLWVLLGFTLSVVLLTSAPKAIGQDSLPYDQALAQADPQTLTVTLTTEPQVAAPGSRVMVKATVTDAAGEPVAGAEVVFFSRDGQFLSSGEMAGEPATTDANGSCRDLWRAPQTASAPEYVLTARAADGDRRGAARMTVRMAAGPGPGAGLAVEVTAQPDVVMPGQPTRLTAVVTRDKESLVPGVEVVFEAGGGQFQSSGQTTGKPITTGADGAAAQDTWSYPSTNFAPGGYTLVAKATVGGQTVRGEVLVRVVNKPEGELAIVVTAQPDVVMVGQPARLIATVTRGGRPVAGVAVVVEAADGEFQSSGKSTSTPITTGADGACGDVWTFKTRNFFPGGYALVAKATVDGEAARGEVPVRVVNRPEGELAVVVTAQPDVVMVGQPARLTATVTRGGQAVPEVEVVLEAGGGQFQSSGQRFGNPTTTDANGAAQDAWTYSSSNFARGYGLDAKVTVDGQTVRGQVMVRVVNRPEGELAIVVAAQPDAVMPGQPTRIIATVTRGGQPLPGVDVVFQAGDGEFQTSGQAASNPIATGAGGSSRDAWIYRKATFAPGGYVVEAKATVDGQTLRGEVLVRVANRPESNLAIAVTAQPDAVMVGQPARLTATVTRNGQPLPGVEVVFGAGDGQFRSSGQATSSPVTTGADGASRDAWIYNKANFAPGGYVVEAKATVDGQTLRGDVRVRVAAPEPKLGMVVRAQPDAVMVGQPTRLEAFVTRDGNPVPGVEIVFTAVGGRFESSGRVTSLKAKTGADGIGRESWSYTEKNFVPEGYVLTATADLGGEMMHGEARVRVFEKPGPKLAIVLRARPDAVMRGQPTRVEAIVTYEDRPLSEVTVVFAAQDGKFQSSGQTTSQPVATDVDGLARDGWQYDQRELAPEGYVLTATVAAKGETARSEACVKVNPGID